MAWEHIKFDKKKIILGNNRYLKDSSANKDIERTIDIVFSSDNNYINHCAAAITSILLNCDNTSLLRFHILDGGISDSNKRKVINLNKYRDFSVEFYDMTNFDFSNLPLNRSYISISTYYRLFLLDVLPKEISKVIYLDCDIIVEKDLKELWETDITDYYAAVVEDEGSKLQQQRLKLPKQNNYFNAGVALFNLDKLREINFKQKCFEYFEANEEIILLQDQDILNGVLNGKCKFLPLCWNTNGRIYCGNDLAKNYTLTEAENAGYAPGIIHYTDRKKPWHFKCNHPLMSEYWRYLKFTDFYSYREWEFLLLYNLKKALSHIFSVKREGTRHKITFLGFVFYKKSKALKNKQTINELKQKISDLEEELRETRKGNN